MYPSSHKDPDSPNEERSPSASSSVDEDSETERSKGDSSDDLMDADLMGLRSSSYSPYGQSMILFLKSKNRTSKHLGISIKYPSVYPRVYPIN